MKTTKIFASLVLALVMITAMSATAFAASPTFTDVPATHWSYPHVEKAYANELVKGVGNNQYQPDRSVSYAEWATMISNLFYANDVAELQAIITHSAWYMNYFRVVHYYGILEGTACNYSGYGTDDPLFANIHNPITRYDMAQGSFSHLLSVHLRINPYSIMNSQITIS